MHAQILGHYRHLRAAARKASPSAIWRKPFFAAPAEAVSFSSSDSFSEALHSGFGCIRPRLVSQGGPNQQREIAHTTPHAMTPTAKPFSHGHNADRRHALTVMRRPLSMVNVAHYASGAQCQWRAVPVARGASGTSV
eukprot:6185824-Pleurochrysis_carterae.AAC.2